MKIFDIHLYLFGICIGILIFIMVTSDTIILIFGRPDFPIVEILYGLIALVLLIGRNLTDKYYNILFIQNLMLKKSRQKIIKTPKL